MLRINSDPQAHNQRNTFKRIAQFTNVLAKTTVSPTSICSGSWNQLILSGMGLQYRLIFKSSHRGDSNPLEGSHLQGKPQSKCSEHVLAPQKARLPPLAAVSPSLSGTLCPTTESTPTAALELCTFTPGSWAGQKCCSSVQG